MGLEEQMPLNGSPLSGLEGECLGLHEHRHPTFGQVALLVIVNDLSPWPLGSPFGGVRCKAPLLGYLAIASRTFKKSERSESEIPCVSGSSAFAKMLTRH